MGDEKQIMYIGLCADEYRDNLMVLCDKRYQGALEFFEVMNPPKNLIHRS